MKIALIALLLFIAFIAVCIYIHKKEEQQRQMQQAAVHLAKTAMDDRFREAYRSIDRFSAENEIRIIKESLEIIRTTIHIDTALQRAQTIQDAAKRLLEHHRKGIIVAPVEYLQYADMPHSEKSAFIQRVIEQVFKNASDAALELKTPRGRLNRMKAFFAKLHEKIAQIPPSVYPRIDELLSECGLDYTFESIEDKPAASGRTTT